MMFFPQLTPWIYNPFLIPRVFVVKMQWVLFYKNGIIQVLDESKRCSLLIRRIPYLDVANRFFIRRYYRNPRGCTFNGYGKSSIHYNSVYRISFSGLLAVYGYKAYYYQTGANPSVSSTVLTIENVNLSMLYYHVVHNY